MTHTKQELLSISSQVRKAVVSLCLTTFWKEGFDLHTLEGACGIASYGLARALPKAELVIGGYVVNRSRYGHAWVETYCAEGYKVLIDITSKQFHGNRNVYMINGHGRAATNYQPDCRGECAVADVGHWYNEIHPQWKNLVTRSVNKQLKLL